MRWRLSVAGWWTRARLLVLGAAVVVGMAVGALAFYTTRLTGVTLYTIIGGLAAAFAVVIVEWFNRTTAVSEVEVTVPQLSRVKFAVTRDHKVLARRIVIEMASRVTVQRLDDGQGRADEAIASLFKFFVIVRDLLVEDVSNRPVPERPKVDVLAMNMLNVHLRPFLSTWHRAYEDWRADNPEALESDWPDDQRFRDGLRALQDELRPVAVAFATMADYTNHLEFIGLTER